MLGTNTKRESKNRGTRYSYITSSRGLIHGDSSKDNTQFGRTSHMRTTHMRSKGYTKVT